MPASNRPTICIAEDRPLCEPGIRLLLQSLVRAEPDCTVVLFCPFGDSRLIEFVETLRGASIEVRTVRPPGAYSWNAKPQALLQLLSEGAKEVVWIDSDVIVSSQFVNRFMALANDVIVVTEEALWGKPDDSNALRARLWEFQIGRKFPFALNSAVLRVTPRHVPLLECWRTLLESESYKEEQAKPWRSRQVHMVGDQDVLTALLCNERFCNLPVKIFSTGVRK